MYVPLTPKGNAQGKRQTYDAIEKYCKSYAQGKRQTYDAIEKYCKSSQNEKRGNKQCLLDTPRRVTVNNKRLISIHVHIKSEKHMHIYKSHRIIKNYKG